MRAKGDDELLAAPLPYSSVVTEAGGTRPPPPRRGKRKLGLEKTVVAAAAKLMGWCRVTLGPPPLKLGGGILGGRGW